jgi:hypothetical protein
MEKYLFQEEFNLWYHSIKDNNWDNSSYKKIMTLRNLFDYQLIVDTIQQKHYQDGMFFLMRGNIFPTWEDPKNRLGSCLSFKVESSGIIESWKTLLKKTLTNNVLNERNNEINGISITPKKEFNIIKLWFLNDDKKYVDLFNEIKPNLLLKNSIYKKHGKMN